MGHDIYARKEVAYLRRNAGDNLNRVIYQALGVEKFYNGVSGSGDTRIFSRKELSDARDYLNRAKQTRSSNMADQLLHSLVGAKIIYCSTTCNIDREIEFVENCLKEMGDEIEISFG